MSLDAFLWNITLLGGGRPCSVVFMRVVRGRKFGVVWRGEVNLGDHCVGCVLLHGLPRPRLCNCEGGLLSSCVLDLEVVGLERFCGECALLRGRPRPRLGNCERGLLSFSVLGSEVVDLV